MAGSGSPRRRSGGPVAGTALGDLARIVADRRVSLDLTQSGLGALADVSVSTIHKLENGQVTQLPATLKVLAALGLGTAIAPRPVLAAVPDEFILSALGSSP